MSMQVLDLALEHVKRVQRDAELARARERGRRFSAYVRPTR